jgi:hypothetical protein
MATKPQAAAKPPVIRTTTGSGHGGLDMTRLLPAWIISAVMHVVIALLFLFLGLIGTGRSQGETVVVVNPVVTDVDDQGENKADLTSDELGNDPDVPLNYNVDRLAEVSVPGVGLPDEPIGIPGASDGPTMSVSPPPGANRGLGSGAEIGDGPTTGLSADGLVGGFHGLRVGPGGLSGRSAATREQMVKEGGGNGASEAAVGLGLKFLALHQGDDGRWSLEGFHRNAHEKPGLGNNDKANKRFTCNCGGQGMSNDTAGTAFGVLPFLAAGITPRSANKTDNVKEDYTKNVDAALRFLMAHQDPKTGDLGGGMYSHGLATIALCEAYGLSADQSLKVAAQKAIDFIIAAQDPGSGGWRYSPRSGGDTSVVGWQLMALKSGQMSGLKVPTPTLTGASRWLDSCESGTSASGDYGYGYVGKGATPTMTAVGLLCRQYLGWSPRKPELIAGVKNISQHAPGNTAQINSMYFNYYATQVMHHMGGNSWENWNPKMREALIRTQDQGRAPKKPHQLGSWSPEGDAFGAQGGRIMQTSLSLLTLEVYYRHLPLYRRDVATGKEMDKMESK